LTRISPPSLAVHPSNRDLIRQICLGVAGGCPRRITNLQSAPTNLYLDAKGRLRTRLLQVVEKRSGERQIVVYHNVDMKPDV
jgi:hypothetical protein